jgi:hypothetical protein
MFLMYPTHRYYEIHLVIIHAIMHPHHLMWIVGTAFQLMCKYSSTFCDVIWLIHCQSFFLITWLIFKKTGTCNMSSIQEVSESGVAFQMLPVITLSHFFYCQSFFLITWLIFKKTGTCTMSQYTWSFWTWCCITYAPSLMNMWALLSNMACGLLIHQSFWGT